MEDVIDRILITLSEEVNETYIPELIRQAEEYAEEFSRWTYGLLKSGKKLDWPREEHLGKYPLLKDLYVDIECRRVLEDYMLQLELGTGTLLHYRGTGCPLSWPDTVFFEDGKAVFGGEDGEDLEIGYTGGDMEKYSQGEVDMNLRLYEDKGRILLSCEVMRKFAECDRTIGVKLGCERFIVACPENGRALFLDGWDILEEARRADRAETEGHLPDSSEYVRKICSLCDSLASDLVERMPDHALWVFEEMTENDPVLKGFRNTWWMTTAVRLFMAAVDTKSRYLHSTCIEVPNGLAESFCPVCGNVYLGRSSDTIRCLGCGYEQEVQKNAAYTLERIGRYVLSGHTVEDLSEDLEKARRSAVVNVR